MWFNLHSHTVKLKQSPWIDSLNVIECQLPFQNYNYKENAIPAFIAAKIFIFLLL